MMPLDSSMLAMEALPGFVVAEYGGNLVGVARSPREPRGHGGILVRASLSRNSITNAGVAGRVPWPASATQPTTSDFPTQGGIGSALAPQRSVTLMVPMDHPLSLP